MPTQSTKEKPLREYTNKELAILILKIVGAGVLLASVFVAPNLAQLYAYFNAHTKRERRKIYFKMRTLSAGGYVALHKEGYTLTAKGKKELEEGEVWGLTTEGTKPLKGWCVVMYDIPARKKKGRHALRFRLEELGAKRYQNSVYYHRHDLRSVLAPFTEFYGIRLHVRFMYVKKLEGVDI